MRHSTLAAICLLWACGVDPRAPSHRQSSQGDRPSAEGDGNDAEAAGAEPPASDTSAGTMVQLPPAVERGDQIKWALGPPALYWSTYLVGRARAPDAFLLYDGQTPDDPLWRGPYSEGRILQVDLAQPHTPHVIHGAYALGGGHVFHGRHMLGFRGAPESFARTSELITFDAAGSNIVPFDIDGAIHAACDAAGVTCASSPVRWVEGRDPMAFAWIPSDTGPSWIGTLSFDARAFVAARAFRGSILGAVADEGGTLYVSSTDPDGAGRITALGDELSEKWSITVDGVVAAAFEGALVLGTGAVIDVSTQQIAFTLASSPDAVFITREWIMVAAKCGDPCTRVTVHDRLRGTVIADLNIPLRFDQTHPVPTSRGSLLLLETRYRSDLADSMFDVQNEIRLFEVGLDGVGDPFGSMIIEGYPTAEEMMLFEDLVVVRVYQGGRNMYSAPSYYYAIPAPGLRPPIGAWAAENGVGTPAPE